MIKQIAVQQPDDYFYDPIANDDRKLPKGRTALAVAVARR
jgi:hypothetical protein